MKQMFSKLKSALGFAILIAFAAIYSSSCSKDFSSGSVTDTKKSIQNVITSDAAKSSFVGQYGETLSIKGSQQAPTNSFTGGTQIPHSFDITPIWSQAKISAHLKVCPLLIVPVQNIPILDKDRSGYSLVFYRDSLGVIKSKLQVYVPDSAYLASSRVLDVNNFTGILYQIQMDGSGTNILLVENGRFITRGIVRSSANIKENECPGPDCPNPAGSSSGRGWFSNMLHAIVDFFTTGDNTTYTGANLSLVIDVLQIGQPSWYGSGLEGCNTCGK